MDLPVYRLTPEQLGNATRREINRRNIEAQQKAQQRRSRARSSANRLARAIRDNDEAPDASMVGLYRQLQRIAAARVVGPSWGSPRPGRRW